MKELYPHPYLPLPFLKILTWSQTAGNKQTFVKVQSLILHSTPLPSLEDVTYYFDCSYFHLAHILPFVSTKIVHFHDSK